LDHVTRAATDTRIPDSAGFFGPTVSDTLVSAAWKARAEHVGTAIEPGSLVEAA
jgi:hypothetical protein